MQTSSQQRFTGERALFKARDIHLQHCTFADGESPLKESRNIALSDCSFQWKYPLWYSEHITLEGCAWHEMARAGVWYTSDISLSNCIIQAPKNFRRAQRILLRNVTFSDAAETLWHCDDVTMEHVSATGNYFGMNSSNIRIDNFNLVGNYSFDGACNVEIHNARMLSKDAFWNCENVTVYDSYISGQYIGWNSKHIRFVNCTIESEQGFCYMDGIELENCTLLNTDLSFEYCSDVRADVKSEIDSVKNPYNGTIAAKDIGEVIFDDPEVDSGKTRIVVAE